MRTRQIIIALAVLILLAVIIGGISYLGNIGPIASLPAPAGNSVATTSPILGGTLTSNGNYSFKEDADYYTIDVAYPATIPTLSADASAKAELTMEKALSDDVTQFKTDGNFANLTAEDVQIQGLGPDRKYAYGATYKQYQSTTSVSYIFTIYEDTLGAHPNGYFKTFVFDMQGNQMSIADLFQPGSNWLEELSLLVSNDVVSQVKQRLGIDDTTGAIFPEGLSPNEDNFQNFAIDGTSLLIEIPPYQVAAYAAGSFEVKLPLSSFQGILK